MTFRGKRFSLTEKKIHLRPSEYAKILVAFVKLPECHFLSECNFLPETELRNIGAKLNQLKSLFNGTAF